MPRRTEKRTVDMRTIGEWVEPGSRVLDGRITAAQYAIVMRKGQNAAAGAYLRQFVEEIKNDGLIKSAIAKAGLRGVGVAAGR